MNRKKLIRKYDTLEIKIMINTLFFIVHSQQEKRIAGCCARITDYSDHIH